MPAVCLRRPLAGFVEGPLRHKDRHELLDHSSKNEQEEKNTELLILDASLGSLRLEIAKPNKESLRRVVRRCRKANDEPSRVHDLQNRQKEEPWNRCSQATANTAEKGAWTLR